MRVGIGRRERIEAMRSELRVVKSDIAEMETTTQRREEKRRDGVVVVGLCVPMTLR